MKILDILDILKKEYIIRKTRDNLKTKDFTILSQNQIGGMIYNDMKQTQLSPTIDTIISSSDFIKFINKLDYYLNQEIIFEEIKDYPIGKLDDIYIHFINYKTIQDANQKWHQRKKKINFDKMIVLMSDQENFDEKNFEEFKKITYPKILLTTNKNYICEDSLYFDIDKENFKEELIEKRQLYNEDKLIEKINELSSRLSMQEIN